MNILILAIIWVGLVGFFFWQWLKSPPHRHLLPTCYDCGRPYEDNGFQDLLVQKSVWEKISPTGHEGGLLCPSCLICCLADAGMTNVPAVFVSGPLRMVSAEQMKEIFLG